MDERMNEQTNERTNKQMNKRRNRVTTSLLALLILAKNKNKNLPFCKLLHTSWHISNFIIICHGKVWTKCFYITLISSKQFRCIFSFIIWSNLQFVLRLVNEWYKKPCSHKAYQSVCLLAAEIMHIERNNTPGLNRLDTVLYIFLFISMALSDLGLFSTILRMESISLTSGPSWPSCWWWSPWPSSWACGTSPSPTGGK